MRTFLAAVLVLTGCGLLVAAACMYETAFGLAVAGVLAVIAGLYFVDVDRAA